MNVQQNEAFGKQQRLSDLLDCFQNGELSRQAYLEKVMHLLDEKPAVSDLQPVTLDHLTMKVPNIERSSHFYQEVLDMPVLRVEPDTHYLGVGNSFMGLQPSGSNQAYIDHFSLGLMNFSPQGIVAKLAKKGVSIEGEVGDDTVRFVDPNGLQIQLSSTDYALKQTTYRLRK